MMTNGQKRALNAFYAGFNVFLSGEAGTGKSYVLRKFLESDVVKKKNLLICAPTGIAAININGVTLHRAFSIPVAPLGPLDHPDDISKTLLQADIIVIDEISMCRFDVFQYVACSIQMAEALTGSKKQLIVVGDFFQLPPVISDRDKTILKQMWGNINIKEGFAFQAPLWNSFHFENILLTESMRQSNDQAFLSHLNELRIGNHSSLKWINDHASAVVQSGISLCPTNKEAETINAYCSDKVKGSYTTFTANCFGKVLESDKPAHDIIRLKPGVKVMSIINDTNNDYQNGSIGIVTSISKTDQSVTILFDNGKTSTLFPYTWYIYDYELNTEGILQKRIVGRYIQLPIKIAYAITIHKSQGQTFESCNLNPSCFAFGQLYVALSRLTSINGLHLRKRILPSYLKVSKEVIDFYSGAA